MILQYRKNDTTSFHNDDPIRLVNNGFAYCFKEARLATSIGGDIEINKVCGPISTIMRAISNKDGDLLSQFDDINENDIPILVRLADLPVQIRHTPHQKMLIDYHTDANRGKIKGYLFLEDIFGFCKTVKKVTNILGFHLFLENGADPENARFFLILIRRREIELLSDGNKLIEIKVI